MQYGFEKSSKIMIIKLDKDEWLMESLIKAFRENKIEHALVIQGIGMLKMFELGSYDGKKHVSKTTATPFELIGLGGTVAQYEGDYSIHLHASLADDTGRVIGGHLKDGKVAVIAEIMVLVLNSVKLTRKPNPDSNLAELYIEGDNV